MNKKRKNILIIIVVILLAIVLAISIGGAKQKSNFTKQDKSWGSDFIATLDAENYLGNDIVADLKDVKVKTLDNSDGNTTFVISKFNEEGVDIHNVQYIVKDDLLKSYRYKNYTFKSNDGKKIEKRLCDLLSNV